MPVHPVKGLTKAEEHSRSDVGFRNACHLWLRFCLPVQFIHLKEFSPMM